jgi:cobalamin biosynthesis protein CbiD
MIIVEKENKKKLKTGFTTRTTATAAATAAL